MNRELLERPFDATQIKQRQGAFGDLLDYVEGATVVQRLNDALDGLWSFRVVEYKIDAQEVLVLGQLTHTGISKMQFGKATLTRSRSDNSLISLGDDLKAAATDALKKCATLFGVGLHLYLHEAITQTPASQPVTKPSAPSDNGRITARQLAAIYGIGRAKGMSNKDIRAYAQDAFNRLPDFLSRQEASAVIQRLQGDGHA